MLASRLFSRISLATLIAISVLFPRAADAGARREGNLLLVVPVGFENAAPLQDFIAAKTAQGLTVDTYVVASGTSRDTIRNYVINLWQTNEKPDYILLVGDTSGSSSTALTIPNFNGTGPHGSATDWPYGCMPGGIDWYPDIPVGRFSAASLTHLQNMVDKTLVVESGDYPDPTYTQRGAFLANPSTSGVAEPTHDWIIENYFVPRGYEAIRIYAAQGGNTADVTNAVNRGCLWTVYMGHSGSSGWWTPAFYQDNVNALTNLDLYGLVFGWSCNSAAYTLDECYGETWLRAADKGAAAYISAATSIYYGGYEDWMLSSAHEKAFFSAFFQDDIWEIGPAWVRGLYNYLEEHGGWDGDMNHLPPYHESAIHDYFEEFVILGDPSLNLAADLTGLAISPTRPFETSGMAGGPFVPDHCVYTLKNNSTDPIEYAVACETPWLTLGGTGGTIAPDDTVTVTVSLNELAETFHNGVYTGTIQFTNVTTHDGDAERIVTLTVGVPTQRYEWNLDENPGWATTGEWAFGQPTGQGGSHGHPDPSSGATGTNVYGVNLNGDYTTSPGGPYYLTSESVNLSDVVSAVTLRFKRWLNIDTPPYARASIQINNGEGWQPIWNSPGTITDNAWQTQEYNITEIAAGKSAVQIRWAYTVNTGALTYSGWNIDDIEIWGVEREPALIGDVDGDWDVDLSDLGALLATYGLCEGDPGFNAAADFDASGCVTLSDLGALLANYGVHR